MIIVRLAGGMGNQMFQYALGRHLAIKNDTELKLDLSFLLDRTPKRGFVFRDYALNVFNIQAELAQISEVRKFVVPPQDKEKLVYRLKHKLRISPKLSHRVFRQPRCPGLSGFPDPRFAEQALSICDNSYLIGYWQSEKYFLDIEETIRRDFTFNFELDYETKKMLETIESSSSVCVWVRRKEYVGHPMFDTCDTEYFHRGILRIAREIKDPHFFIFSDDLEWCQNNLRTQYPLTFVSHKYAGKQYECYFRLMCSCRHFVIANSTYGWWAAWLSKNPNKIVIAPKKWFGDKSRDTTDVVPETWIRI